MVYLEARPGPTYETHIVRSQDLVHWESSPFNPMLQFSGEDKKIGNPNLTIEQRERIVKAVNRNNSDVDLCEFKGQVIIYYSWGDQQGTEFLAHATYNGALESFFRGFFPGEGN
jgi:alpha-L-fucosidase